MASDFEKPNKVHTLFPEEIMEKLWPLPVSSLFFAGERTRKKLEGLGIYTIGELARTDPEILISHLKKQGEVLWAFANGIDNSPIEQEPEANKGYGNTKRGLGAGSLKNSFCRGLLWLSFAKKSF